MDNYKYTTKPVKYWGEWCIKRKIQKKVRFIFFWHWRTIDTRYFGPYKDYLTVLSQIREPIEFCR